MGTPGSPGTEARPGRCHPVVLLGDSLSASVLVVRPVKSRTTNGHMAVATQGLTYPDLDAGGALLWWNGHPAQASLEFEDWTRR